MTNEAETRAEHIDTALKAAGWGVVEGSRVLREHGITLGRLQPGVGGGGGGGGQGRQSLRAKAEIADYVLVYRNTLLAVIEAKAGAAAIGSALRPVLLSAGASLQTSALRRPIALGEVQQWVRLPAHTNDR